jgi:hypothetical protein
VHTAGCGDTVIADGRILMRRGKVLTLNEHDLYAEAQDRATSLIRRTDLEQAVATIWPIHWRLRSHAEAPRHRLHLEYAVSKDR